MVDIVSDNPPTIRFKNIPNGMGHIGDAFYLSEKKNRCVVCGSVEKLNRHHVLPYIFFKNLPESVKSHNYHDILLNCFKCHKIYEKEAHKLKQKICEELGFDINQPNSLFLKRIASLKSAANALLKFKNIMPKTRQDILLNKIREYLNKSDITDADLQEIYSKQHYVKNENFLDYGSFVISKVENIQEFVERWREHFITVMQPKYMPDFWDVRKPFIRQV